MMMILWLLYLFIIFFETSSSLKVTINSRNMPLKETNSDGMTVVFKMLRSHRKYNQILTLLNMKLYNYSNLYVNSCSSMSESDYMNIYEIFYRRDKKSLAKLLPADCILSMKPSIFLDKIITSSLLDLPINIFSASTEKFSVLKSSPQFSYFFSKLLISTLKTHRTDTNWNNLFAFGGDDHQNLKSIFINASQSETNFLRKTLHFYLRPSMILTATSDDVSWMKSHFIPNLPFFPSHMATVSYVKPVYLSAWTDALFRTITLLSFYFEIEALRFKGMRLDLSADNSALKQVIDKIMVKVDEILSLYAIKCSALKNILFLFRELHEIFFLDVDVDNVRISRVYRSLVHRFDTFIDKRIPGDWFINLFSLFWKRKFDFINTANLKYSLGVFFERRPTISAISTVFSLLTEQFKFNTLSASVTISSAIPADRIEEVFNANPSIIAKVSTSVPFKTRYSSAIRTARMPRYASDPKFKYYYFIRYCPPRNKNQSLNHFIDTFQLTISSIQRTDNAKLCPFSPFILEEQSVKRYVNMRYCLNQFFSMILMHPKFSIKAPNFDVEGRPVIVFSPLITNVLARFIGQALGLSATLQLTVPFVLDFDYFESIFDQFHYPSMTLYETIGASVNEKDFIDILHENPFQRSPKLSKIRDYFSKFASAQSSAADMTNLEDTDEVRRRALYSIFLKSNIEIRTGFNLHVLIRHFSTKELYKIIFSTFNKPKNS